MDQSPPVSPVTDLAPNVTCARCGAPFVCGYTAGAAQCWCMHVAAEPLPIPEPPEGEDQVDCLCPACLHLVQAQRGDAYVET